MITRRKAVLGLSAAALGSAAPSTLGLLELLPPPPARAASTFAVPAAEDRAVDERLRRELAQLASNEDSEEGVPVILACINQVPDAQTRRPPPVHLTPFNVTLTAQMRQNAAAWQRIRPNAPASDVARLIQLLAYRDLSAGRLEQSA